MDAQLLSSSPSTAASVSFTETAIQNWLVAHVAALLKQPPSEVDVTLPFSSFALDSMATIGMTGDLEDWLGVKLPATLVWDYPTIEQLARYLECRRQR